MLPCHRLQARPAASLAAAATHRSSSLIRSMRHPPRPSVPRSHVYRDDGFCGRTMASSIATVPDPPLRRSCPQPYHSRPSARPRPWRRRLPRPSRGLVRGDGPRSRSPSPAVSSAATYPPSSRCCGGRPLPLSEGIDVGRGAGSTVREAPLRLLREVARPAAGQRLRPPRKCLRSCPVAIRARRSHHRDSQEGRQRPPRSLRKRSCQQMKRNSN